jgi:hypothetical protein
MNQPARGSRGRARSKPKEMDARMIRMGGEAATFQYIVGGVLLLSGLAALPQPFFNPQVKGWAALFVGCLAVALPVAGVLVLTHRYRLTLDLDSRRVHLFNGFVFLASPQEFNLDEFHLVVREDVSNYEIATPYYEIKLKRDALELDYLNFPGNETGLERLQKGGERIREEGVALARLRAEREAQRLGLAWLDEFQPTEAKPRARLRQKRS